jgi:biopolymer transport protein ExbD
MNVTPLVDVVLVLLIIFMVVARSCSRTFRSTCRASSIPIRTSRAT